MNLLRWWRARSSPPGAPAAPVAPVGALAAPVTTERLHAVITARGYHVRTAADEAMSGIWDGYRFVVRLAGADGEFLSVRGSWGRTLPAALDPALAQAVNDWNRDKVWPTVFTVPGPGGTGVRTEVLTDVSAGATNAQLLELVEAGLASGVQFFQALGRSVPPPEEPPSAS